MSTKEKHQRRTRARLSYRPVADIESIARVRSSRYAKNTRFSAHFAPEEESFHIRKGLNAYMREALQAQGRRTFFQRVYIFARNVEEDNAEETVVEESRISLGREAKIKDFRVFFRKQLDIIMANVEANKLTPESLTGFFVCMDGFTFLIMEGDEDMMGSFFEELSNIHDFLWTESKVFMVEDNIAQTYFSILYCRRSPAFNINEKFPPATVTDLALMSVQHLKLKEKVKKLAETLSEYVQSSDETESETPNYLPPDLFNKLLPEIQRIELVFKAHKFYRNIKDFAQTYNRIPTHPDEDILFWPVPDNYTPVGIFERSAFDVNLTFADYGSPEAVAQRRSTIAIEEE